MNVSQPLTVAVTQAPVTHTLPSGRVLTLDIKLNYGALDNDHRYVMAGGYYGESSISAEPSFTDEARLTAHWNGYIEANTTEDRPQRAAVRQSAVRTKLAPLVAQAEALPPSMLLRGPRGLTISLKACEVFPEDPGEGCPAVVQLPFGRASSTYDVACDMGYLAADRHPYEDVDLTARQKEWLEEVRVVVDTFRNGWFKRIEANPSARPSRR